jgi:hypothetical protein
MNLTRYTVQKGKHNFSPMMPPIPRRKVRGFAVEFIFDASCWYPPEAITPPSDWHDWSKLLGVTQAFSANNRNSCMAVFRPGMEPGMMRVGGYVNHPGTDIQWRELGHVEVGERGRIECDFHLGRAHFSMGDMDFSLPYEAPKWVRQVGMWHGGNQPAPQWMQIEAAINYET